MFPFVHSDGPGHLQRAAGRRGSVCSAVRRERAQRRGGRGSVLVSRPPLLTSHSNHESASMPDRLECAQCC